MFNAKQHRVSNPIQTSAELPVGHYQAHVEEVMEKTSSTGFKMITLKLRITNSMTGSFINALHWENLCIGHDSEQVRLIAMDKLAEICEAHGIEAFENVGDLARQIGKKEVSLTINKSRAGRIYAVYRKDSYFRDRLNNVSPLAVVAAKAKSEAEIAAVQAQAAEIMVDAAEDDIPF